MDIAALGAFVRQQRKDRGLTQLDVAELAEVSDRFLRELEPVSYTHLTLPTKA